MLTPVAPMVNVNAPYQESIAADVAWRADHLGQWFHVDIPVDTLRPTSLPSDTRECAGKCHYKCVAQVARDYL